MAPLDHNTLLRTAVKLTQAQWQIHKIELRAELDTEIPPVMGDSNQLLQVFVQTLGNALYAVDEAGNRTLTVATRAHNGIVSIEIGDSGAEELVSAEKKPSGNTPPDLDSARLLSGLGLSACQGILQQHHGRILWEQEQGTRVAIRIEIPITLPAAQKTPENPVPSGIPAVWQSQPFA
jgi:two-component system NtrC family sensor kinase